MTLSDVIFLSIMHSTAGVMIHAAVLIICSTTILFSHVVLMVLHFLSIYLIFKDLLQQMA